MRAASGHCLQTPMPLNDVRVSAMGQLLSEIDVLIKNFHAGTRDSQVHRSRRGQSN